MKIYAVCHCILNTCAKTQHETSEDYCREEQDRLGLLKRIIEQGDQLFQLPCPEFLQYGHCRWGHARSQFDNEMFKDACRKMLQPIVLQLAEYSNYEQIEIIGVNGSPSCGVSFSFDGTGWGGEFSTMMKKGQPEGFLNPKPGVFIEVLMQMLKEKDLKIPITALSSLD